MGRCSTGVAGRWHCATTTCTPGWRSSAAPSPKRRHAARPGSRQAGTPSTHLGRGCVAQLHVSQRQLAKLLLAPAAQAPLRHARRLAALAARPRLLHSWVRAAVPHVQHQGRLQRLALPLLEWRFGAGGLAGGCRPSTHRQLLDHHMGSRGGAAAGVRQHAVGRPARPERGAAKQPGVGQAALARRRLLLAGRLGGGHQALPASQGADWHGARRQQRQARGRLQPQPQRLQAHPQQATCAQHGPDVA